MERNLSPRRRAYDLAMRALVWLSALLTCALLVFLIGYIFYRGMPGLSWQLISGQTSYIRNTVGILPNLLNTLYIILVAMAVVLPLKQTGSTAKRCAWWGFWASLAEPAAAVVGIALTSLLTATGGVVLPILLSVAAGAMVFITVEELIPESQAGGHGHGATYGFLLGFWLMALLGILGG